MTLPTATDLRRQLNLDADLEPDNVLVGKLAAAAGWIEAHIGTPLAELQPLPAPIGEAVLMLAAHLYENREATLVGVSASEVPFGVRDLIRPFRVWEF